MSKPFTPRIHVETCDDFHVISQALFFLSSDNAISRTLLGVAAKELAHYFDTHEREIHTEHTDTGQKKVAEFLSDLYFKLPDSQQRNVILDVPELQITDFISSVSEWPKNND